jgi:hypothetical protein
MKRTVAKALRMYIKTYSLFKIGHLSTNIELTLYKALIRSVMTHACSTWGYAADAHLLKLQRPQNRVRCAIGNLDRCTPVCILYMALKIPYMYNYINYVDTGRNNPKPHKSKCTWYQTRRSHTQEE